VVAATGGPVAAQAKGAAGRTDPWARGSLTAASTTLPVHCAIKR